MATTQSQQILIPKKVYIGDTAELRCSFNSDEAEFKQLTEKGETALSTEIFTSPLDSRDFEIINLKIAPAGVNYYQLTITFKPWKTGSIQFPSVKIGETELVFESVNIVSLTEQDGISSLKENTAPLLLPGTAYKLYGAMAFLTILLIIGIRLIVKHKQVMIFIKNRQLLRKYKKNRKATVKGLNELLKDKKAEVSDPQFAEKYQHIMRNYMEVRFGFPFTKTVTSELMKGFYQATGQVLSENKENAFGQLAASFIRTDYIRYSKASDSNFGENEKKELIEKAIAGITTIETVEKVEKEGGEKNA